MLAVLSLGSNLGDRKSYITEAKIQLERRVGRITQLSPLIETQSWGYDSHDYLNQVLEIDTSLSPEDLLLELKKIEIDLGRDPETKTKPGTQNYHDRTIDIDILYYENVTINTPQLTIPHPQIEHRPFIQSLLKALKNQNH